MNNTLTLTEIEELKVYLKEIRDASKEGTPTEETLQKIHNKYSAVIFKALNVTLTSQHIEGEEENETENGLTLPELLQKVVDTVESAEMTADGQTSAIQRVIKLRPVEEIDFPLDKINRHMWSFAPDANGQYTFNFNTAPRGKEPVPVYYSLDFDSLEDISIVKTLTNYDRRVYTAIGGLYKAGYTIMTIQQIYNAMGCSGHAGPLDRNKIYSAITKMNGAHIKLDNKEEVDAKYNYKHFAYDGSLLPMERISAIVNGQVSDSVIRPFREPPVISLARSRKQLTTIDRKLLQTPVSQTEEALAIEHYMITEIEGMKAGRRKTKMLYATICECSNITSPKQISRAQIKIKKILDYWTKIGYIAGYLFIDKAGNPEEKNPDGVIISINKKGIEKKN